MCLIDLSDSIAYHLMALYIIFYIIKKVSLHVSDLKLNILGI
jgi:hypothetical protein